MTTTARKVHDRQERRVVTAMPMPRTRIPHDPASRFVHTRSRENETEERVSANQAWRAQYTSPYFWFICTHLPWNDIAKPTGGRYRDYPDWLLFLIIVYSRLSGSVRSSISLLMDPAEWQRFIEHVHFYVPDGWTSPLTGLPKRSNPQDDAADRLKGSPMQPPRDSHVAYWLKCWKRGNNDSGSRWYGLRTKIMTALRVAGLEQAHQQGLLDPDHPFHWKRPYRDQSVNFDGTVIPIRKLRSGKDRAGCHQWTTGDNRSVHGTKFVTAMTRGEDYKSRVVLGVAHITTSHALTDPTNLDVQHSYAGEGAAFVALMRELVAMTDGIRLTTADSALRGKDVEAIQAMGPIVVNWPCAASNPGAAEDRRRHAKRVEKTGHVSTIIHERGCTHRIYYRGGTPVEEAVDEDGNPTYLHLAQVGYHRRRNKNGTCRHYAYLNIPCPDGDSVERIPMFHTAGPSTDPSLNRGEVVRLYPTDSPQFDYVYGGRNDTEGWHADIKRMRLNFPDTILGQELFMVSTGIAHNAVAHAQWRKTNALPNALENTA